MSSDVVTTLDPSLAVIFPTEKTSDDTLGNEKIDPDAAWNYYSHYISRNPTDLTLHTRRVFFAMQHKEASLLAGSLHDLFYTLKDAGEKLRIRLLKASQPYLSEEDTLYFSRWIKASDKHSKEFGWVDGAVLSDGLIGPDQPLVEMQQAEGGEMSPLEEARSCIEYGQLELAQDILSKALETDPDNKVLIEELDYLETYAKSRAILPEEQEKQKTGTFSSVLGKIKSKLFSV